MYNKIKWFLYKFLCLILSLFLNIIKKDNKLILFGLKPDPFIKDLFIHNSKYFFLYLQNNTDYKTIWLCDDKKMLKHFRKCGIKNVHTRHSLKGIYYIIRAKYWMCDITANQITRFNSSRTNSIVINFWHGIPLKKIGYDAAEQLYKFKQNGIQEKIYRLLKKDDDFLVVNGNYEQLCYTTAFQKDKEYIKILGSPRLDVLLNDIPNADLFMEKDFEIIKAFKQNGKKLFIYMPTWRDTGANVSCWLKSEKLREFLKQNNIIFICKLHPYDKNSNNIKSDETIYIMDNESDVYPILKYTDSLITDYSSVYFDYLLIDKPILYFVPDLEEYQEKCRGFYRPFEELTAGIKVYNEEELMNAMQDIVNGIDNYKEKRKILRDEMFKYQDGKNCERAMEFIRSLD